MLIWKAPSLVMNPTLSETRIARAISEDPDRGRAEWEAEWRSGVAAFLDAVLVDQGVRRDPLILPPREGVRYRGGADPCGSGVEEFAWCVDHREGDRVVIDLVSGRRKHGRQHFNLEEAVRDCCTDMRAYGETEILGDRYSANWVKEAFAREGLLYRHAEKPKSECYREMLPLFVMGKIEIPNDTDLVRQLKLLERRTGSQGKDIIDHPSGARDDRANVLALAVAALPPEIIGECGVWAGGTRIAATGYDEDVLTSWTERGTRGAPGRTFGDW